MSRPGLRRAGLALAATLAAAGPAIAVGLGPLKLEGLIDGPSEGFTLDLYNPYADSVDFVLYPVGIADEVPQVRVDILPAEATLGGQRSRRVMVIANDLAVGETYQFRVCAQRKTPPEGIQINARVCSKISAHRVA